MTNENRAYELTWTGVGENSIGIPRVFVPLARNGGCPIGCSYCYIPEVGKPAIPISPDDIQADIVKIQEDERFQPGPEGTLISIGCDTEPFLRVNLAGALAVIGAFRDSDNPIQVATKLIIPDEVLEVAKAWPQSTPPLVVNTSITTLSQAHKIERGAPAPTERATNPERLRRTLWCGAVIIKPLLSAGLRDKDGFVTLFEEHPPDAVVVGVPYRRQREGNEASASHPLEPTWVPRFFEDPEQRFVNAIKGTGVPVFHTSPDVNRWAMGKIAVA